RLRDLDNHHETIPERLSRSPSSESNSSQQDLTYNHNINNSSCNLMNNNTPDLQNGNFIHSQSGSSSSSQSQPIPRDDVVLKMAVLKGVYDQIMKDMKPNDYDKESSSEDTMEFPGGGKKTKFSKLKDFKFLKIGDKQ
ncbi:9604_t:CDS:1, partial [Acaulospora morrowiae]